MSKIKLTDEIKSKSIDDIQIYFFGEKEEDIGRLSAELFLDFIMKKIGPMFYNQGIIDSHNLMEEKIEELYALDITIDSY